MQAFGGQDMRLESRRSGISTAQTRPPVGQGRQAIGTPSRA